MEINVGRTDQVIRLAAAVVIFALGWYFQSWWGLIGLVPLATALTRRCPPYAMLGISTCSRKPPASSPQAGS